MQISYVRISKTDGSQNLDLQKDVLVPAGVGKIRLHGQKLLNS
jgi:hypothetical protein